MLNDLERKSYMLHIGGAEYRVRYSLNSRLCLEQCYKPLEDMLLIRPQDWSIEDILQLVRAGIVDLPENKKAVINRDWAGIKPTLDELGRKIEIDDLLAVKVELMRALTASFTEPVYGAESEDFDEGRHETDYGQIRALYCDVLRRPNSEFWTSTLGEIYKRIDDYLIVKGLKEAPLEVNIFDDD